MKNETDAPRIAQTFRPDRFFTASQLQRLGELMDRWRAARDRGEALLAEEQAELEALVEAELYAPQPAGPPRLLTSWADEAAERVPLFIEGGRERPAVAFLFAGWHRLPPRTPGLPVLPRTGTPPGGRSGTATGPYVVPRPTAAI